MCEEEVKKKRGRKKGQVYPNGYRKREKKDEVKLVESPVIA